MNANESYPANSTANIFLIDQSNHSANSIDVTIRFTDSNASERTKHIIKAATIGVKWGEKHKSLSRGSEYGIALLRRVLRGQKI